MPCHVAELVMQISSFERYSASCANRKPQTATWQMPRCRDAEMPSYLQRVAGMARLLFEAALECVAVAEGLALP
jgi:hypothetical protein